MSYQIRYGQSKFDKTPPKRQPRRYIAFALFGAALFAALCFPSQLRQLRRHALPFLEPEVTQAASQMVMNIQNGESPSDAVLTFCRELIVENQDPD